MDISERAYYSPIARVCPDCVTDPHLKDLVDANLDDEPCTYCLGDKSADIDYILDAIEEAIQADYTDPANELPWDGREGGYQGKVQDGWDIVESLSTWTDNARLLEDVLEAFAASHWCKRDYFGTTRYERLRFGWEDFVKTIKHKSRFLLLNQARDEDDGSTIPLERMLDELGALISGMDAFKVLSPEVRIYRARVHDVQKVLSSAEELGAPRAEYAQLPNRMSPAGIPMFYGALNEDTAVAETFDPSKAASKTITLGTFQSMRPLRLVDFTNLPPQPSDFDQEKRDLRDPILFLRRFVDELTQPISRDGSEHVEYLPTQMITEYIRYRLCTRSSEPIDGVIYSSSKLNGGQALVLFATHRDCGPREKEFWEPEPHLILRSVRRADPIEFNYLWNPSTPAAQSNGRLQLTLFPD